MSKKTKAGSPGAGASRAAGPGGTRPSGSDLRFGTRNYVSLGAALFCILLGFFLLSRGSITAAPVLLVLGYCVLIPYGLATGGKGANSSAG